MVLEMISLVVLRNDSELHTVMPEVEPGKGNFDPVQINIVFSGVLWVSMVVSGRPKIYLL